ncbi:MAG TPA: DNA mismatch repair endonuclease MutL, partial [Candidatus Omnitrophota bacterium]|nr:DNA mismatch repair endonuclease MutL [Candidatus Omnitrophota bacterium]
MQDSKVRLLNDDVIGKIAAGEVVDRPASAVKELVENAIDAGSSSIQVDIEEAGEALIRVSDDGEGMSSEDAKLAFLRHATSKIRNIDDLEKLGTFGFRGEALASISAVSIVELTTCNGESEEACYFYVESGIVRQTRPAARSRGTTIEVRNLFYNVPARKKFLKKESTELSAIVDTVSRFILANPGIEIILTHNGKEMLRADRGMKLVDRVGLILGADTALHMKEVRIDGEKYSLHGYVSEPSITRKDRQSQIFFVNKRYVTSKLIGDALYGGYRSLLERGRFPSAVLFITVDPSSVDVNIHPTKLMVKFDDERAVRVMVEKAVMEKFIEIKNDVSLPGSGMTVSPTADTCFSEPLTTYAEKQNVFKYEIRPASTEKPVFVRENEEQYVPAGKEKYDKSVAGVMDSAVREKILEKWTRIFQIGKCYIVRVGSDSIVVTDQHAAHERIYYEYFTKKIGDGSLSDVQSLLFPVRLDLTPGEAVVMEKVREEFLKLGFDIQPFGKGTYVVQTAPAIFKDKDIKTIVSDVLSDLSNADTVEINTLDEIIKITSCRAAIKAG